MKKKIVKFFALCSILALGMFLKPVKATQEVVGNAYIALTPSPKNENGFHSEFAIAESWTNLNLKLSTPASIEILMLTFLKDEKNIEKLCKTLKLSPNAVQNIINRKAGFKAPYDPSSLLGEEIKKLTKNYAKYIKKGDYYFTNEEIETFFIHELCTAIDKFQNQRFM